MQGKKKYVKAFGGKSDCTKRKKGKGRRGKRKGGEEGRDGKRNGVHQKVFTLSR